MTERVIFHSDGLRLTGVLRRVDGPVAIVAQAVAATAAFLRRTA